MKLKVLNRIRHGDEIAAEIQHENPGYRKWVSIFVPEPRDPRSYDYKPITHKFEIQVLEQEWYADELDFHEEGFNILAVYELEDEEAMLAQAAKLVPSTDFFDVPWRAFNFVSPE